MNTSPKPTLLIGASENPQRYAYLATQLLRQYQHEVTAVGKQPGKIGDVSIITSIPPHLQPHTITLYIRPELQKDYYQVILDLHPQRIIFNPGTENPEFEQLATSKGIECLEACTLVLLKTQQY